MAQRGIAGIPVLYIARTVRKNQKPRKNVKWKNVGLTLRQNRATAMPTPLSLVEVQDREWPGQDWAQDYRRVARRYERELRRIRNATACDAAQLRQFADEALTVKGKKK
jgi:hypothetical protein